MVRPVNCPVCGYISEVDLKKKRFLETNQDKPAPALSATRQSTNCKRCTNEFFIRTTASHSEKPLFDVDLSWQLHPSSYYDARFEYDDPFKIEYDLIVREGAEVDMFVVSEKEFTHFKNNERFRSYEDLMEHGMLEKTGSGILDPGLYHFTICNPDEDTESKVSGSLRGETV